MRHTGALFASPAPRRSCGYVHALLGLLLAAAAPVGAEGQVTTVSPLENVELKKAAYGEAKSKYDGAAHEADRLRNEWNRLLAAHEAASRTGDQDRVNELLADFEQRSGPKNRAENAWRTAQEEWIAAGKALISAIDGYLEIQWKSMEQSVGAADDEILYTDFEEWEERLREVEEELPEEPLELEPMPEVRIREADTPREIEFKARLIENRVAFYENLLDELDRDIASLTKRLRREQSRRDSRRARDRFHEGTAPIGDQRLIRTDAAAATGRETIEDRIEAKKALREEVEKRMEELKQKAEDFRQQAGGTP